MKNTEISSTIYPSINSLLEILKVFRLPVLRYIKMYGLFECILDLIKYNHDYL